MAPFRHAFTLIELLMVVAILAILAGLLISGLGVVREVARRAVCASNLRQFGMAIAGYAQTNRGQVPSTVCLQVDQAYYPQHIWLRSPTNPRHQIQWAADKMLDYLDNVSATDLATNSGVWFCPSNPRRRNLPLDTWHDMALAGNLTYVLSYAYFGRVDLWSNEVVRPELLTARKLSSERLVMSDLLFQWHVDKSYSFNHGPGKSGAGRSKSRGPGLGPGFAGINQLFGDGRVAWKEAGAFPAARLDNPDGAIGRTFVRASILDYVFF